MLPFSRSSDSMRIRTRLGLSGKTRLEQIRKGFLMRLLRVSQRKRFRFSLTFEEKSFKCISQLGDRPAAGRRVLAPLTEVRILVPQPSFSFTPYLNDRFLSSSEEDWRGGFIRVPSSSGLGYRPLTPKTRVRVPLGLPSDIKDLEKNLWSFFVCTSLSPTIFLTEIPKLPFFTP